MPKDSAEEAPTAGATKRYATRSKTKATVVEPAKQQQNFQFGLREEALGLVLSQGWLYAHDCKCVGKTSKMWHALWNESKVVLPNLQQ